MTLAVVQHRRDELVNRDPDRCPARACERCTRRCACPPCRCPECLTRPARLRHRHDRAGAPQQALDVPPTVDEWQDAADRDDLTLFDLEDPRQWTPSPQAT